MANFQSINLYKSSKGGGVTAIRPVLIGPGNPREIKVNGDNVTVIFSAGLDVNDDNVFTVNMNGAPSFITDWSGISDLNNFVRINLYTRTLQPEGSPFEGDRKWQYFGIGAQSSARVVPQNVATGISLQQNGVDSNGNDQEQECFRVTMIDGTRFVTDLDGWNAIQNY